MEADRFVLRDATGQTRAELKIDDDGQPALLFYDHGAHQRVEVGLQEDGSPFLSLISSNGNVCQLASSPEGSISLNIGSDGNSGVWLGLRDDGLPELSLVDREGHIRVLLGLNHGGEPVTALTDKTGNRAIGLTVHNQGQSEITLEDTNGRMLQMAFNDEGFAGFRLMSEEGTFIGPASHRQGCSHAELL